MKEKNKILGIDPGFGRLGYAVIVKNGSGHLLEASGCVETFKSTPYQNRLLEVGSAVAALMKKHKPDVVALEKIFFSSNSKTATQIAEVRGMLIYLAAQEKISLLEFTPLEVKASLCGHGRADKWQVQNMVKMLLKLPSLPKYDDTTDAMAIALTAFAYKDINGYS